MNPTRYQKQLQWKIENEKRALELKKQKENQLIEECTFTPKIHTTNSMYHQRERPREENYSNENHVLYNSDFQNKKSQQARKEKKDVDNRKANSNNKPSSHRVVVAGQNNQHIVSHEHLPPELHLENQNPFTNELNHPHETDNDYSKYQPFLHDLDQKLSDSNSETKYFNDYDISYQPSDLLRENENHDDFTVIQILEKERHAWHIERVKLIQCIYLQQMELAQRANASQNRASEIAKEFACTIQTFEERLLDIETNVHKEIQAVRNTTDILKKEILESVTQANQKNNEYLLEKIANLIGKQSDNKLTKASTTSAIIEHHD